MGGSLGLGLLLLAGSGCYGGRNDLAPGDGGGADSPAESDDGEPGEPVGCDGGTPVVTPRPLRRLNPIQYQNTMRALLGDPGFVAEYDATEALIPERGVRQLRDGAELAFSRRDQWTAAVIPCDVDGPTDDACAEQFIDEFAPQAFRRPLSGEERDWLQGVYYDARAELGFADAMEVLVTATLQSPALIYLVEEGTAVEGAPAELRRLTDHEVASRLSYFLWDTMPDDELRRAADAGELTTDDGISAQVERLLEDTRTEARIQQLIWDWMELDGGQLHFALEESDKDAQLYPEFGPGLTDAMRTELMAFVADVMRDDASFDRLLTSTRAYVNGPLAELYGVSGPIDADTWEWVELPAGQRAGLLTRAAFLTVFSSKTVQSPIRRGVFTLEHALCVTLGDPPPDVDDTPIGGDDPVGGEAPQTVRELTDARTEGADCSGCHNVINPIGFSYEHYDAIGRWRDQEVVSGLPIDSNGMVLASDVDGPVADAVELSARLADSAQVRGCFAEHWFSQAVGGQVGELDQCAHDRITEAFTADGDLRQLVVAIALSDSFRYVNLGEVE